MIPSLEMMMLDLSGVTMESNANGERVYYLEEHGRSFRVILVYDVYLNNGSISLSLYCKPHCFIDDEVNPPELGTGTTYCMLYDVITVNLPESNSLPFGSQFVDVNNHDRICEWLIENEIAEPLPILAKSGFCIYPAFKFNIPEGTPQY